MSSPIYRCDICLIWGPDGNKGMFHWSGEPDRDGFCCHDCGDLGYAEQIARFNQARAGQPKRPEWVKKHLMGDRYE